MRKFWTLAFIGLCGSGMAYGGVSGVFVIQPDAALGVTEIPVDIKTAVEIEAALKRGDVYVLNSGAGSVAIKGKVSDSAYLGIALEPNPPK